MSDYDYEPKAKPSKFLRLKDKGQVVKVRIASKPYRNVKVWKEGIREPMSDEQAAQMDAEAWYKTLADPDSSVTENFVWAVIDREDNQPRYLQATAGIYKSIKEYAAHSDWGDPTSYDITITRTEQPGRGYYSVMPSPNKTILQTGELEKIKTLDFAKDMPNARPVSEKQIDDIDDYIANIAKTATINANGSEGADPLEEEEGHDVPHDDTGAPIDMNKIPY